MARKLVVFFDGTWNTPDNDGDIGGDTSTNVSKLYDAVLEKDAKDDAQIKWYDEGVGTRWYNKLRGGAFGVGLSTNIQQGYRFLVENYQEGDEVFVFGFSRGAYTARSLIGMIRNCGLLRQERVRLIPEAYSLYRTRDTGADSENALFFRRKYSREIKIKFLGVWDTVGALGIPIQSFDWFNKSFYEFHDTELSGIVENAYHALAIDEHRENYSSTLWAPKTKPNQNLEQVWFVGAHANIGGGYPEHELSNLTLSWMGQKVIECGLGLDLSKMPQVNPGDHLVSIRDSYREFLGGLYAVTSPRYYRNIGKTIFGGESVHPSAVARYQADLNYRPKNPVNEYIKGLPSEHGGRIRG